jgi:hypothetical protein
MDPKLLPPGTWVTFRSLAIETTPQDLSDLIFNRTGVRLDLDRISVKQHGPYSSAVVSLEKSHIADLLCWALADDELHGKALWAAVRRAA